jgi:hypothetical protein
MQERKEGRIGIKEARKEGKNLKGGKEGGRAGGKNEGRS